jgi:hypothetical protein
MRNVIICILACAVIFIFGSNLLLGTDSDTSPTYYNQDKAFLDLPQGRILTPGKNYSLPRNQVLLEMGTATW